MLQFSTYVNSLWSRSQEADHGGECSSFFFLRRCPEWGVWNGFATEDGIPVWAWSPMWRCQWKEAIATTDLQRGSYFFVSFWEEESTIAITIGRGLEFHHRHYAFVLNQLHHMLYQRQPCLQSVSITQRVVTNSKTVYSAKAVFDYVKWFMLSWTVRLLKICEKTQSLF